MSTQTKWIYYRESAVQSIIADAFMFITLAGAMAINHYYFGNSSFWGIVLFAMVLIAMVGRAKKRGETFTSKDELKAYLNETL